MLKPLREVKPQPLTALRDDVTDVRFYRAVMVEECTSDYITTAQAKGATKKKTTRRKKRR